VENKLQTLGINLGRLDPLAMPDKNNIVVFL
jgi:hypothetical protein